MIKVLWHEEVRRRRERCGISQKELSQASGISSRYLRKLEAGEASPTQEMLQRIEDGFECLKAEAALTMVIDYFRVRFPVQDVRYVIEDILKIKLQYMLHQDMGFYGYNQSYVLGNIFVYYTDVDDGTNKGVLLELKGKGCRQYESYLSAQGRTWYDFMRCCYNVDARFKRVDLAINDHKGILDVSELIEKCRNEECVSFFRTFRDHNSGKLIRSHEQNKEEMGKTLYIGSMRSEIYFCIYEKDYEQFIKARVSMEDAPIKNRFELRLSDDRAKNAVYDLLCFEDPERTVFGIINYYVRFIDRVAGKEHSKCPVNKKWERFVGGEDRGKLKLTMAPEPYTIDRTLKWLGHQVMPMLIMASEIDEKNGTSYVHDMVQGTKLKKRHKKIIEQCTVSVNDAVRSGW